MSYRTDRMRGTGLERAAGAALIMSAVLAAVSTALTLANAGDTTGPLAVLDGIAVITFLMGFVGLRQRVTNATLRPLLLVAALAVAVGFVGTIVKISGVALAVPVVAAIAYVIIRSTWRVGDMAILLLIIGIGIGFAYLVAAQLDPSTGSQNDQGAVILVGLGLVLAALAAALLRTLPVTVRVAIIAAPLLVIVAAAGLGAILEDAGPLVLAPPIIACWSGSWGYVGARLWSASHGGPP